MATRLLVSVAAAAGVALSACQTLSSAAGSCNAHECHVKVTVSDCNISLDPDPIGIAAKDVEIHWDIVGGNATFAQNGIAIKDDAQGEFDRGHLAEQDRKFIVHDKNTFPKTYKYIVSVKQGGAACRPLDPSIINN
jgi:hypothetical protein